MKKVFLFFALAGCLAVLKLPAQTYGKTDLAKAFLTPPESAKPWVFWYWLHGAVSAKGITADMEAMKKAGIGGAYLMPIKDTANPLVYRPAARQLSPQWWKMVNHAMAEGKRLGIKLAFHVSDGFALAGGPWISPENSMQKIVWTQTNLQGGSLYSDTLATPETIEGYYRDIGYFAFPSLPGAGLSTRNIKPKVTTSTGIDAPFLTDPENTKNFSSEDSCWIQYQFEKPFTLRTLVIHSRTNYQSNRLIIETSNDGKNFTYLTRLEPPRHGWQDWDSDYSHAIPEVTARYFRFIYSKEGSEPGAEDLDAAKWKPVLKIAGIELSSEARIHQYEGKNGEVWRVSKRTTDAQVPASAFLRLKDIIDLTKYVDENGKLHWNVPAGSWTIIRMGHTSTGHRNETGGGGKGLECDKFDPAAITLQFNNWFGEILKRGGATARSVVKVFHVDSWECGSQNWSHLFREEFKKRRGYDPYAYLPVMAGIPIEDLHVSEGFLYDVRKTIAELINDTFYGTLQQLAHQKRMLFSAESVAPTMLSDGMLHYQNVDIPMGEFWLNSPTHDKPNDMLDAISGGHIYGKNIIQAEAFTELRMAWDEHPGMLKALGDRSLAMGINRLVYHVFMHNPWLDRKPGVTLDAIGLLFQRDQTWWPQAKAWIDYVKRCQALLQMGKPVTDIAVFTGEELPRRSLLPERLVSAIPGVFGKEAVAQEQKRLSNTGQPVRVFPAGVSHAANTTNAQTWNDPLRGYAYDSYNPDALLRLSSVRNGRIELSTGGSYGLLVFPGIHKLSPDNRMSTEVAAKINSLVRDGATVILGGDATQTLGLKDNDQRLQQVMQSFYSNGVSTKKSSGFAITPIGKGRIISGYIVESSFVSLGIEPDVVVSDAAGKRVDSVMWTHRKGTDFDIYFFTNQGRKAITADLSLRIAGKVPELWDPVSGSITTAKSWRMEKGRTLLPVRLQGSGSVFVVLQQSTQKQSSNIGENWVNPKPVQTIDGPWMVRFDTSNGGPQSAVLFKQLTDWSKTKDTAIRYYSGKAVYETTVNWNNALAKNKPVFLNLGNVANLAEVYVNGTSCGIAWTEPYRVDIAKALKQGQNKLRIEVVNTWANRMIGDARLSPVQRITNTVYPFKLEGKPLLPAGLLGPVVIETLPSMQ